MRAQVAALLLMFGWVAQVAAHDSPAIENPAMSKTERVTTPIAAQYEVRLTDRVGRLLQKSDWYFWREANRIETARSILGLGEIWMRDERGEITLRRVFHPDRRIIEYLPRELKALGMEPSWDALGAVIDPRSLDAGKRIGTTKLPQGRATTYEGVSGGQRVKIWWLDEQQLPAKVERQLENGRFVLALKSLHASAPAAWPRTSEAQLNDYQLIDIADFGDMEYDPFIRKVERLDALDGAAGARPRHAHHAH